MKKSNWIQLTTLCFILSLTAACGGKNSSGGGNNNFQHHNQYSSTDKSILSDKYLWDDSGAQRTISVFNRLLQWGNSPDSNKSLESTGFTRGTLSTYNQQSFSNCPSWVQKHAGFLDSVLTCSGNQQNGLVNPIQFCTYQDSNGVMVSQKASQNRPYSHGNCSQDAPFQAYNVVNNEDLQKILGRNGGTWLIDQAVEQAGVYVIVVGTRQYPQQLAYIIDTNRHSLYNPVIIQDFGSHNVQQTLIPRYL